MRVVGVPRVELVGNAFGAHDAVEILVLAEALIVPAGGEDVGVVAILIEKPGVRHVGKVVSGEIEIAILIVIANEEVGEVECT